MRNKKLLRSQRTKNSSAPWCKPLPSIDKILEKFDYDPKLSAFMYKVRPGQRSKERTYVGSDEHGYIHVSLNGETYAAHRLIWKLYTGSDPVGVIDHINGIRDDNRVENLRDVTAAVNLRNRHLGLYREELALQRRIRVDRRNAERENRERNKLAKLLAKYGCQCHARAADGPPVD
jgi:hypothetical protein